MLKSLTLLSVSAVTLLATTQAYSHVLCAPNNPQIHYEHSHDRAYTVPRIQPVTTQSVQRTVHRVNNQQQQQHLQAQRARQQQALANQQRINQQRRAQAQRIQQQVAARKAQQIRQQQAAAQRARAARQQAALQASRNRVAAPQPVYRQPVQQPQRVVYRQPAPQVVYQQPVQQIVYRQPAPQVTYIQAPAPVYVAPVTRYIPARTSVSFQVNTGRRHHRHARRHIKRVHRSRQVVRYPKRPRHYNVRVNAHRHHQWKNKRYHK